MNKELYINGQWTGKALETIEVFNPGTGEKLGTVPKGGRLESEKAVNAASEALEAWKAKTGQERAGYLREVFRLMQENTEEIAEIMTKENGKTLTDSRQEVTYAASFLDWFADEAKRVYGRNLPGKHENHRIDVIKKPVGVVAAITPWNFPAAMITRKLAPALAAGCTIIIKPASATPYTAIKIIELCEQAGIPKGVVNLLTGSASEITKVFMEDSRVRKVSFTGSTEVGKKLIEQSAHQVKKLSLELGGHGPLLVFNDADLDTAVRETLRAKFRNGGQSCIAANRLYVQSGVYAEFTERFSREVKKMQAGNGMQEASDIGAVIDQEGFDKVKRHVDDAVKKGGTVTAGGNGSDQNQSYFYEPTVIKDAHNEMIVMKEETFGPVAPIQSFETEEEAIRLANDTPYGLAAYVFTDNVRTGTRVTEALDFGVIGWNDGVPSAAQAPFGGMKESGYGREGGVEGIEDFLETKYVAKNIGG
ncbi:NAD-dependent succinate-semialdehyde dehydrogenase [Alkalicoccus halolimnae]|uniref:NAD-dependent succinate-semialdehyde dehydrogenase n=1 Tax=Alkalicoccus halolimnae TaxID=1667239 RepID=A0A5C7FKJ8_9BACI|nr:NAD-dependent succinate-semialdehyde dehydrogenase [Alkalicoccus halolimnae]TXF86824.1 NAD-dependent succinate-semialdehyde dehydrogenase [Alkalicoccus halolimnae]